MDGASTASLDYAHHCMSVQSMDVSLLVLCELFDVFWSMLVDIVLMTEREA